MDISGFSGISGSLATQATGSASRMGQVRAKVESAVADKLGMSVDDLRSQEASGQSLADIAKSKGVSRDDLVSTIQSTLQSAGVGTSTATNASAATSTTNGTQGPDLTQLANRIADQVGRPHHHHHASSAGSSSSAALAAATSVRSSTGQDPDGDGDGASGGTVPAYL